MIFAELNMKGPQHLMVNAGFLDKMRDGELESIIFGDKTHLFEISKIIKDSQNIIYFRIPVLRSGNVINAIFKTFVECILVFNLFMYSLIKKQSLFFLSSYAPVKILIEFLSRIHPYRVYLVHHGELDALQESNTKRYAKFVRKYFSHRKSPRLVDVFLSEGIRRNVFYLVEETPSHLAILHPFPLKLQQNNIGCYHNRRHNLTVGYFGALAASNRSRLELIIASLEKRVSALGYQDFNLLVVAPAAGSLRVSSVTKAKFIDSKAGLSNAEFFSIVSALDLAIFPYEHNQYALVASGIASDCLVHGIHFLTAYSSFFEDWITNYPDSGTLYSTFEDLLAAISDSDIKLERFVHV